MTITPGGSFRTTPFKTSQLGQIARTWGEKKKHQRTSSAARGGDFGTSRLLSRVSTAPFPRLRVWRVQELQEQWQQLSPEQRSKLRDLSDCTAGDKTRPAGYGEGSALGARLPPIRFLSL